MKVEEKKRARFLSEDKWVIDDIWLSLVIGWIKGTVKQNKVVYLGLAEKVRKQHLER
ncbi:MULTISPECIES: hypothetical protein [unclassified Microcoleus]|uniref:hypothetical protein n=1 Tax=unclassified Microcoleus TaxID=2642155 RepID=UPI002FD18360